MSLGYYTILVSLIIKLNTGFNKGYKQSIKNN